VRRPLFGEPLIAHPAPCARVHATWHPHSANDYNRDQHDNYADNQQHIVLDLAAAPRPPETLYRLDVLRAVLSGTAHDCEALVLQAARLCSEGARMCRTWSGLCTREQRRSAPVRTLAMCNSKSINATVATFWPLSETIQEALR
jgi:hypothetical protein